MNRPTSAAETCSPDVLRMWFLTDPHLINGTAVSTAVVQGSLTAQGGFRERSVEPPRSQQLRDRKIETNDEEGNYDQRR